MSESHPPLIMKLAIAQINCTVGDLSGNARKILDYANRAKQSGAKLVITPELALSGYPPEDLLLRDGFRHACGNTMAESCGRDKWRDFAGRASSSCR